MRGLSGAQGWIRHASPVSCAANPGGSSAPCAHVVGILPSMGYDGREPMGCHCFRRRRHFRRGPSGRLLERARSRTPFARQRQSQASPLRQVCPGTCDSCLREGGEYEGPLNLTGSGLPGSPNTVGSYGEGPKPHIMRGPGSGQVISLYNGSHWEIADLGISGGTVGVFACAKEFGIARGLHFRRLNIHRGRGNPWQPPAGHRRRRRLHPGLRRRGGRAQCAALRPSESWPQAWLTFPKRSASSSRRSLA